MSDNSPRSVNLSDPKLLEETLNKECAVSVRDDAIIINVEFEYEIPRNRCRNGDEILGWIVQLCGKKWITPAVLRDFAYIAAKAANTDIVQP